MAAPYSKIIEQDESNYASSENTIEVYCAGVTPCGPVGTLKSTDSKDFYKKYTPSGQYKSGYSVSMLEAQALFDIECPVNFNRVIPQNALYGGAVVSVGTNEAKSLTSGLATPESYIFADPTEQATAEKVQIQCKADVNGSLGGKYFYLPGQEKYVSYKVSARAEEATITCKADVQGSLRKTYLILPGQKDFIWFGTSEDTEAPSSPSLAGKTAHKCVITANASANTIATTMAALTITGFTLTSSGSSVTIAKSTAGAVSHGNAGTSGFDYITSKIGLNEIPSITLEDVDAKVEATVTAGATADAVATATNSALSGVAEFTSSIVSGHTDTLEITAVTAGYMLDAVDGVGSSETGFIFTTITQGSSQFGSEALLFYTENPNNLNISFKIISHQDNPTKAPLPNTFLVEVYKDGILEGDPIVCSRIQDYVDGNGNPLYVEQAMLQSAYLRCRDNVAVDETEQPVSIKEFVAVTGGTPGTDDGITSGDYEAAVEPWQNKDDFDITLMLVAGYTSPSYIRKLNTIAATRGDCCVINSVPYYVENTAEYLKNIVDYRKTVLNLNSSYIATFSSNLEVYNSSLNKNMYVPSDGYIAGAIVNAARNYEIFYPIIGFKRGVLNNVLDVKHRYTREEMDELYNNQINPIRFIPGQGIVIWGQKTMQVQPSSLDRLNARLLLCSLKPRLQRFLETFIGELNTDKARDALTLMLNGVFDEIKAKEGIIDYQVSCDPLDPNAPNKLSSNVRLAITPGVEFVDLTLTLTPAGVVFS